MVFDFPKGDEDLLEEQSVKESEKIVFKVSILKYTGSTRWIESTIREIKELLDQDTVPPLNEECDYCIYTVDVSNVVL